MGRDAAGVIGIRLARAGDEVVSMSVVQPDRDLLVLTETGYGKRVALPEFRRKHRGGQGVMLIPLEGRKTGRRRRRPAGDRGGRRAAPHQRRRPGRADRDQHDQPLFVGGPRRHHDAPQRGRPGRRRSPPSARGWRSGRAWATMAAPRRGRAPGAIRRCREGVRRGGGARVLRLVRRLHRERQPGPCPQDLPLPRHAQLGQAEVFSFANENIFVKILDNVREKDVFLVQPTCRPVNQSIMELLIMIDAFKRASAGRITAVIPFYATAARTRRTSPGSRSPPASSPT